MALRVTVVNPEGDENMFLVASSTEVEDLKVIRPYIDRVYFFFFFGCGGDPPPQSFLFNTFPSFACLHARSLARSFVFRN